MKDESEIIDRVMARILANKPTAEAESEVNSLATEGKALTEFVGTAPIGDTIGLVIANVDADLAAKMGLDQKYRSIGVVSARTGASPQVMAVDEAVKATNTEVVSVEMPRDTKTGAGHGSLITIGGEDVSDVRRAVEVALAATPKMFGDIYANDAGDIEMQYTARASYACNKAFGAPIGRAYGLVCGAPAGIGVIMADTAVKAANVDIISYASPSKGTSLSNEAMIHISGDSGAVRQAVIAAREIGIKLLSTMGAEPKNQHSSYI